MQETPSKASNLGNKRLTDLPPELINQIIDTCLSEELAQLNEDVLYTEHALNAMTHFKERVLALANVSVAFLTRTEQHSRRQHDDAKRLVHSSTALSNQEAARAEMVFEVLFKVHVMLRDYKMDEENRGLRAENVRMHAEVRKLRERVEALKIQLRTVSQ